MRTVRWLLGQLPLLTVVRLAVAAVTVTACTLLITPLARFAPADSLGPVYLVAVVLMAATWGARLGVLTAIASAGAFDWFHIAPYHSFAIQSTRNTVALGVFLVAAISIAMVAELAHRLHAAQELRRREAESRARVLAAADAERRRVVRDLHDGAQQRLVHTVITLKLARRALARSDASAPALVAEAVEHAEAAMTELRDLARGILPPALVHGGLRGGMESLVARMPLPVSVDLPPERAAATVEETAYFIISEALTNTVKHAQATHAAVSAKVQQGALIVEVRDDGTGGAHLNGSTGLLGLEDRATAIGGRLTIDSPPGRGTVVRATLPLRD